MSFLSLCIVGAFGCAAAYVLGYLISCLWEID